MSLPHVTEHVQWGEHLVFKVGGKMFSVVALEPDVHVMSFKASPENFVELQEVEGILPAPYLARAQWLAIERFDVMRDAELRELLDQAYRLVYEKLPKKTREQLESPAPARSKKKTPRPSPKKASAAGPRKRSATRVKK